jgi:hypothetical protein
VLKIPAEYDKDAVSAKFKDISHQLSASLLCVSAATESSGGRITYDNSDWDAL